jgi:hypothetical protein
MRPASDEPRLSAPGKPSLEQLLRVKRAERPDEAFWAEFDRGFRDKQLAAIIEPRPWWLGLSILSRRLAPFSLPLSAGAAALLAVMVLRSESSFGPSARPVVFSPAPVSSSERVLLPSGRAGESADAVTNVALPGALPAESAPVALASSASEDSPEAMAEAASDLSPVRVPMVAALLQLEAAETAPTPSQLTIAQNLAAVQARQPELLPAAASASLQPAVPALDRPIDPRQARLLAMAEDRAAAPSDISNLRERMVHRLANDDTVYGASSRLATAGDRFSLSF